MSTDAFIHLAINGIRLITMQSSGTAQNDMRYVILNVGDKLSITTGGTFKVFEVKRYTK